MLLMEEWPIFWSEFGRARDQSLIPGAVGLYIVSLTKDSTEKQILANKELVVVHKELTDKQILVNKELIVANKGNINEIIKAYEARIENLLHFI